MSKEALVLSDESTAGTFVTAGLIRLPSRNIPAAIGILNSAKEARKLPADARIHCRVLFHPDARRKSVFKILNVPAIYDLLAECVRTLSEVGASWWGASVDKRQYIRRNCAWWRAKYLQ